MACIIRRRDCIIRRRRTKISLKPERVFLQYTGIARSAARRVSERTGWKRYDLIDEATSKLGEMAADWSNPRVYDPTRGAVPCTWIYAKVFYHLLNFCQFKIQKREIGLPEGHQPDIDTFYGYNPDGEDEQDPPGRRKDQSQMDSPVFRHHESWLERFLSELSDEAQALVRIVIEAPRELAREFRRRDPAQIRIALLTHLQRQGWSDERIDAAWSEIQSCLN